MLVNVLNLPWTFAIYFTKGTSREAANPSCFGWSWRPGSTTCPNHSWVRFIVGFTLPRIMVTIWSSFVEQVIRPQAQWRWRRIGTLDAMRFEQLALQVWLGGDTFFFLNRWVRWVRWVRPRDVSNRKPNILERLCKIDCCSGCSCGSYGCWWGKREAISESPSSHLKIKKPIRSYPTSKV